MIDFAMLAETLPAYQENEQITVAKRQRGWEMRVIEPPWQDVAFSLVQGDALKAALAEAEATGLDGPEAIQYVAARLSERKNEIEEAAQRLIVNVEEVGGWKYIACPTCAAEQWARLFPSALDAGKLLAGDNCDGCGKFLNERTWTVLPEPVVYAPPPDLLWDDGLLEDEDDAG